jgi:hypothetical protein
VWEADTAREVNNLRGHTGAVFDVAWRPDSGLLATAGEDATVKLWDANEGKVIKSTSAHGGGAFCVRFAADGRLVTAGRDNTLKTWAADGAAQKTFPAFAEQALRCAFSSDGQSVIGGDWLGNVKVFSAADAKELRTLTANPPTIAMRIEAATSEIAAKQKAADAAQAEIAAAEGASKKDQKSLDAALATLKAVEAAKAALAETPSGAAAAALNVDTIDKADKALVAAAAATEATIKDLREKLKESEALVAAKKKALDEATAALQTANQKLAAAQADQAVFDSAAERLAAAVQAAQDELQAFTAAYGTK